jgi:hypothetical protein
MPQDLPPTGGYEPVQYKVRSEACSAPISIIGLRNGGSHSAMEFSFGMEKRAGISQMFANQSETQRNLPARGFRPSVMLLAVTGVVTFGFWKVGKGIREQKYALHSTLVITKGLGSAEHC